MGAERNILIIRVLIVRVFCRPFLMSYRKKSKRLYIKFFVNNIGAQKSFDKLCRYKGRFLHIYDFPGGRDSMAALHAKVISVDQEKTLITSANLSYHGQEGNIELGTLVKSTEIAKQVDDIFTHLIFNKVVKEI